MQSQTFFDYLFIALYSYEQMNQRTFKRNGT